MSEKYAKDSLGKRLKERYEDRTQTYLPRRTYSIIRLDGKNFHTYTKECQRPYDMRLMQDMDATALFLCKEIQGARAAFIQSDEISILVTDFEKTTTEMFFNGNIQKIVSITASMATAYFNSLRYKVLTQELAMFDSRIFTIPDPIECANLFVWRQKDAERNSLQMLARSYYTHKELISKNNSDLHDLIHAKNDNWNNYPARCKRGSMVVYKNEKWQIVDPPVFVSEPNFLRDIIPMPGY